ncbi:MULTISPECIES: SMI1/KNR4 family protein [unclassified Streptomyces]|uniref:SMI1/KNR4 family protein n=1 Tax=unclassified Streptomyces TaxID=2593676 RepID=UPI003316F0A7
MTTDLVQEAWTRIDAWLREHAPRTFATLRPPAGDEEIAAAQQELGVVFPPDLVASLLRHDGAVEGPEAFRFDTGDRLLGVSGILGDTGFLRGIDQGPDGETEDYWLHGYVKFGSYDATSDGLLVDCRTGRDSFGAIGRFFDETGTRFGVAGSLGEHLAELAAALERGREAGVVTFNGRLFWETPLPARREYGAGEPLPGPDERLPELDLSYGPTDLLHVSHLDEHEELGALIATLPPERVAEAARKQVRRLAVETGLNDYPEVAAALDAWERGAAPPNRTGPLALRLRAVLAQADARRDHTRRWAAERIALGIWGSPYRSVCESATVRSHFTLDWRADLHADLGRAPLPPIPDDRFWGALRNPAIDSGWYAAQYAQDQE